MDCAVSESPTWLVLRARPQSPELMLNQPLTGWILESDAERRHVEVSDSNFGFLPISDRMRPRYVASLRRLVAIIERGAAIRDGDADAVSEVKGMFSRCARRDQWDWRAVHLALEEPDRDAARTLATQLGEIGAVLRAGDNAAAVSSLKQLSSGNLVMSWCGPRKLLKTLLPKRQGSASFSSRDPFG